MSAYPDNEPVQSLEAVTERQNLSVTDDEMIKDGRLRRSLVWPLFSFFMLINLLIDVGIFVAYQNDTTMIIEKVMTPQQRLITPRIIEILIGATTAQLGAIAFGTFRAIFLRSGGRQ